MFMLCSRCRMVPRERFSHPGLALAALRPYQNRRGSTASELPIRLGGGILRPAQLGGDPPFQRNEPEETERREARPFAGIGTGSAESLLERRAKIGHLTGVGLEVFDTFHAASRTSPGGQRVLAALRPPVRTISVLGKSLVRCPAPLATVKPGDCGGCVCSPFFNSIIYFCCFYLLFLKDVEGVLLK